MSQSFVRPGTSPGHRHVNVFKAVQFLYETACKEKSCFLIQRATFLIAAEFAENDVWQKSRAVLSLVASCFRVRHLNRSVIAPSDLIYGKVERSGGFQGVFSLLLFENMLVHQGFTFLKC